MNDEEINRAIAEHLGWTGIRMSALWEFTEPGEDHQVLCGLNPKGNTRAVPNYCCDLYSMQAAEKAAFGGSNLWEKFQFKLLDAVGASGMSSLDGITLLLQATARQRAEAFLRTVGKWRGEE